MAASGATAVIVTGGTGGLGRALVPLLLSGGARVAVAYRREEEWRALRDLAAAAGAGERLFGLAADLASADGATAFVDAAAAGLGGVDGVALVAGGWAGGARFEEAPAEEWESMRRVNLDTAAHVCRAALPHLLARGGSVVAVGSRGAETAGAGMAAYAVAKQALHALVRVLAAENVDRGVRFNAVLPGTIDTPANRAAMPGADRSSWTPPEAIARTIAFLLSAESAPVTGALVPVEGGGALPARAGQEA
jgi:NAD(P)-dependent dehydrogenase (short-subunit alcohol dehydrogenase family)